MDLKLFLRGFQIDSCFIFALMNYNKLNFQLFVESTLTGTKILQKEVPEGKVYPYLLAMSKSKATHLPSRDEILKYLLQNKYIHKGVSHSAWEQQTFDHLIQNTYPLAEGLPLGLTNRLKQSFRIMPKTNPGETLGLIRRSFKDTLILSYQDHFKTPKQKTSLSSFQPELDQWQTRLNGQNFHGGLSPDKADFFMYGIVEANWIFLKPVFKGRLQLENWKERMNICAQQDFRS